MPDLEKIKKTLQEKLRELTARAKNIDDDLRQAADDDWEEHAVEAENDEVLEGVGDVTLVELREVKFALARIDAGDYGTCSKCGMPIAPERLEALPYATNCVGCS